MDEGRRWTPSNDESSLCPWPGELKMRFRGIRKPLYNFILDKFIANHYRRRAKRALVSRITRIMNPA